MLQPLERVRSTWVDAAWLAFVGLSLVAVRDVAGWQALALLIACVTLIAVYGVRLRRLGSGMLTVAVVTVAPAALIGRQALGATGDVADAVDAFVQVVLLAGILWHDRKRRSASDEASRSLRDQRRFLEAASHELGTPITIALGHSELIERAAQDPLIAEDARVVVDELLRLRRLNSRLLLLASAARPDFLEPAPVEASDLVADALSRWSHLPRSWTLDGFADATVIGDADCLTVGLDALIENAVQHTSPEEGIELGVRREARDVVIHVADSGCGMPTAELRPLFDRLSDPSADRVREAGEFRLGLAVVQAVAEAHGGSVRVRSTLGRGSVFELRLPVCRSAVRHRMVARASPHSPG